MYAVIAENDVTQWADSTGVFYHFPKRYAKLLRPGTKLVYYKGKIRDKAFAAARMSPAAHYFAIATAGRQIPDKESDKGDLYLIIEDYRQFSNPVPISIGGTYLESIPQSRVSNFWRDGVRSTTDMVYQSIVQRGHAKPAEESQATPLAPATNDLTTSFESGVEGDPKKIYTTVYERDRKLRTQAILIHGTKCKACGLDFGDKYGEIGTGYIQVHHIKPISKAGGKVKVNPETDLIPLCANCHVIVHRKRDQTLSIDDLIQLLTSKT